MSAKTVTTWTCSRCGAVETVDGTGQPPNWSRAYFANPPNHAEHRSIGDLCNPCGGYLVTFVNGGDVAEAEQRDAEVERLILAAEAPR